MPELTRRQLLTALSTAGAAAFSSACTRPIFINPVTCKVLPPVAARPQLPPDLLIDAHCHIFNGTDLQADKFLTLVTECKTGVAAVVVEIAAALLQDLVWNDAPNGQAELRVINSLLTCSSADVDKYLDAYHAASYKRAAGRIRKTAAFRDFQSRKQQPMPVSQTQQVNRDSVLAEMHRHLKGDLDSYRAFRGERRDAIRAAKDKARQDKSTATGAIAEDAVAGALAYVIQNFQYRCVTIHDYLTTYEQPRKADLMLAAMVDYDWWLNLGSPTQTHLDGEYGQIAAMEKISLLTRGRVHGLAPFDPLREIASCSGQNPQTQSSLKLVQNAIQNQGCVGVKLYPPMGFAAWGNADIGTMNPGFWARSWLPPWMNGEKAIVYPDKSAKSIGQRLDDALGALYEWCVKEEVPILAHTAASNGPSGDFEQLAGADHWQAALKQYSRLRISFGHFGDFTDVDVPGPDGMGTAAMKFTDAICADANINTYADISFASAIFDHQDDLRARFESYYGKERLLMQRVMYGTDWDLLMHIGDVSTYQQQFADMFTTIDQHFPQPVGQPQLSQRFFGYNAVDWIGLRTGGCARGRLEDFYKGKIDIVNNPPDWMAKLG